MPYYDDLNVDLQQRRNQLTQVSDPFSRNYNDKLNRMLDYPYQPEQVPMEGRTGLTNQAVGSQYTTPKVQTDPTIQPVNQDYSFLTNTLSSTGNTENLFGSNVNPKLGDYRRDPYQVTEPFSSINPDPYIPPEGIIRPGEIFIDVGKRQQDIDAEEKARQIREGTYQGTKEFDMIDMQKWTNINKIGYDIKKLMQELGVNSGQEYPVDTINQYIQQGTSRIQNREKYGEGGEVDPWRGANFILSYQDYVNLLNNNFKGANKQTAWNNIYSVKGNTASYELFEMAWNSINGGGGEVIGGGGGTTDNNYLNVSTPVTQPATQPGERSYYDQAYGDLANKQNELSNLIMENLRKPTALTQEQIESQYQPYFSSIDKAYGDYQKDWLEQANRSNALGSGRVWESLAKRGYGYEELKGNLIQNLISEDINRQNTLQQQNISNAMTQNANQFNNWLQSEAQKLNIDQFELSRALGIDDQTMQRIQMQSDLEINQISQMMNVINTMYGTSNTELNQMMNALSNQQNQQSQIGSMAYTLNPIVSGSNLIGAASNLPNNSDIGYWLGQMLNTLGNNNKNSGNNDAIWA